MTEPYVTAEITLTDRPPPDGWGDDTPNAWEVVLHYDGRTLEVPFWTGLLLGEPTAADVLACLLSDATVDDGEGNPRPFEDWADDYGFDTDSRKAEATWRQCVEQTAKLREFLSPAVFDAAVWGEDQEVTAKRLTTEPEGSES